MNTEEKDILGEEETEPEFEFDENGDIIIPEDTPDEEGEENAEDREENTDEAEEDGEEGEENAEEGEENAEEGEEAEDTAPDTEKAELAAKLAEAEKLISSMKKNGKAALAKLGVKDAEDFMTALETLAAEAEGKSLDDYRRERREAEDTENARELARKSAYEEMKKADLAALHAAYPETAELTDVENMPNFKRFGELRDAGLSPTEAYAAANPDAIRRSGAEAGKKTKLAGTKTHLKSNVPKGAKGTSGPEMTPADLDYWRDMFPDKTDKEIKSLFKRANS
jgi:hypothetical protein